MKRQNGFILFDNITEFKEWLTAQKVTRKIKVIQEHHTATRVSGFKGNNHLALQKSMKDFHVNSRKFSDIAQHFTIFPDGKIATGRNLNVMPAGISGANTGAICIENYGWFDKGKDSMSAAQKNAIIAATKILCDRFNIKPSESTIIYHAWYSASGNNLKDYVPGKSCKTCPGTEFFGGNTKKAYNKNFLPLVKAYGAAAKVKKAYSGALPTNTLRKGNKSGQVILLQKFLNWFGDYGLIEDNKFGELTGEAVIDFQKAMWPDNPKEWDGVFGPKCIEKAKNVKK